jgi:hypothetical protein
MTEEPNTHIWIERLEYIVERTLGYLKHYQADPAYDFAKRGLHVRASQLSLMSAHKQYADGTMKVEGVALHARMLREAYKR